MSLFGDAGDGVTKHLYISAVKEQIRPGVTEPGKGGKRMFEKLKKEAGVAGLNMYLTLIAMLFVIGIIVMAFALAGAQLQSSTSDITATDIIGNTTASIADATDWFPTFIVIGAVVVLVLLIAVIISALRGAGLMGGGGA